MPAPIPPNVRKLRVRALSLIRSHQRLVVPLECCLPARLLSTIMASILGDRVAGQGERELAQAVMPLLAEVEIAALMGITPSDRARIRALSDAVQIYLDTVLQDRKVLWCCIAVREWAQMLHDQRYLKMLDGGPFAEALALIMGAMPPPDDPDEQIRALIRSGRKGWRHIQAAMRDLDLYRIELLPSEEAA